jgi:hypothetical protein
MERFNPEKEDFTHALVWLRLYSLPQEFWLEEILVGINNTIGIYIKASEATKQRRYTTYEYLQTSSRSHYPRLSRQ